MYAASGTVLGTVVHWSMAYHRPCLLPRPLGRRTYDRLPKSPRAKAQRCGAGRGWVDRERSCPNSRAARLTAVRGTISWLSLSRLSVCRSPASNYRLPSENPSSFSLTRYVVGALILPRRAPASGFRFHPPHDQDGTTGRETRPPASQTVEIQDGTAGRDATHVTSAARAKAASIYRHTWLTGIAQPNQRLPTTHIALPATHVDSATGYAVPGPLRCATTPPARKMHVGSKAAHPVRKFAPW
jgi:hypothetical protein